MAASNPACPPIRSTEQLALEPIEGVCLYWGTGSAFGFLAIPRLCGFRLRCLIRRAFSGSFHGLREELARKTAPPGFIRTLGRPPRINCATILLSVGLLLLFLDFLA